MGDVGLRFAAGGGLAHLPATYLKRTVSRSVASAPRASVFIVPGVVMGLQRPPRL